MWDRVSGVWSQVGTLSYTSVTFRPTAVEPGDWQVTVPAGSQAAKVKPGRLATTSFRGTLYTWTLAPLDTGQDADAAVRLTAQGFEALDLLRAVTAWPDPTLPLVSGNPPVGQQPARGALIEGPAETVIRTLVQANAVTRLGLAISCPVSQGRGSTVKHRPKGDNLLEVVLRLAKSGGLGVDLELVPTTSPTRAALTLVFTVPRDKTVRVRLSSADGTLESWGRSRTPPVVTRAIVVGAAQYVRDVTDTQSIADADLWNLGGQRLHREQWVDGPEDFDNDGLDDAGAEVLDSSRGGDALTMAAREPAGTKAFVAFRPGDLVTAVPAPGVQIVDTVSAVEVVHDVESGEAVEVTPTFGDPDADDPETFTTKQQRRLARVVERGPIIRRSSQ